MTTTRPETKPGISRIDFLEGLRGFLAIWVMFAHIGLFVGLSKLDPSDVLYPGIVPWILNYFDLSSTDAVNMFMILSGFVIFNLLDKGRESYIGYLIRRFFRLWPVFIVCIILGILTFGFYGEILEKNPWSQNFWIHKMTETVVAIRANGFLPYFLCDLPMLHGIVPAVVLPKAAAAFSSLSWCISTEWQFYLCAPLFYKLTKNLAGTACLTAVTVFSMAREHVFDFSVNGASSLLPLQLHWFFLGFVCYLIYRDVEQGGLNRRNKTKIALMLGFVIVLTICKRRFSVAAWTWLIAFGALIDSVTTRRNFIGRNVRAFFSNPITRYFGRISYPIYLIHWPVAVLAIRLLIKVYPQSSWQAAYVILITVIPLVTWPIAHLVHCYMEAPAMSFGKRIATRFQKREPTPILLDIGSNTNLRQPE